jgi:hypothetical protein
MNIHLKAYTDATMKNGKTYTITERFNCWQTPTKVTYQILKSDDIVQAYSDWVTSLEYNIETYPEYAPEDILNPEREPIGYITIDHGEKHLNELKKWLEQHPTDIWTIEWYDM